MTNVLIALGPDGRTAETEAYVTASLWRPDDDEELTEVVAPGHDLVDATRNGVLHSVQARYLDRWSVRDGSWSIDYRRCVTDLQTISMTTGLVGEGRRDTEDPSYRADGISRLSHVVPRRRLDPSLVADRAGRTE